MLGVLLRCVRYHCLSVTFKKWRTYSIWLKNIKNSQNPESVVHCTRRHQSVTSWHQLTTSPNIEFPWSMTVWLGEMCEALCWSNVIHCVEVLVLGWYLSKVTLHIFQTLLINGESRVRVASKDTIVNNGVVQKISMVLNPPTQFLAAETLAQIILKDDRFSTFFLALMLADMTNLLDSK